MGAYLTKPSKEKIIEDGQYGKIVYGSCSMQGWRVSQEDSHNCLPQFDTDNQTSLFAVYDGHGGAEVAKYCSAELPNYIKSLPSYLDDKDLSKALTETFLGFDASLLQERTIERLRQLSDNAKDEPRLEEEDEEDDTSLLKEEASLPLESVLEKYGGIEALPPVLKSLMMFRKKQDFKSPCLSKRRRKKTDVGCSGDMNEDSDEETSAEKSCDSKGEAPGSSSQSDEKSDKAGSNAEDASGEQKDTDVIKNGTSDEDKPEESTVANGDVADECVKENGIGEEKHGNGEIMVDDSAAIKAISKALKKKVREQMSIEEEDEDDEEWNGEGSKEDAVEEGEEEENEDDEEDEEDEDDSGVDEEDEDDDDDDDEDDEDDDDDDDDEEEEVDDESAVLSFGQQMDDSEPGVDSGTTAVVAVIRGNNLVVANAGDSRCVLCREGAAVDLSVDHKPEDEPERHRIVNAGGVVTQEGRVNGGLNLSRAIGDHAYKKNDDLGPGEQMITASPDIQTIELDPKKDEFIVLACDGIWNSYNSQEVVDFVKERLSKESENEAETKLSDICGELFDSCLAEDTVGDGTGCDNMTCILVRFDWNAKEPTPTVGKLVKGVKRIEPSHDASDVDGQQTAKKIRVESD